MSQRVSPLLRPNFPIIHTNQYLFNYQLVFQDSMTSQLQFSPTKSSAQQSIQIYQQNVSSSARTSIKSYLSICKITSTKSNKETDDVANKPPTSIS